MSEPSTPLMRQYAAVKKEHPNALLFFRLGDFYELFFEDAVVAAKELQITLTSRNKEKGIAIPMCGVPYHAAEEVHRQADSQGVQGRHLRADGRPARGQNSGEARSDAGGDAGHGGGFAAGGGGEQLSGVRGAATAKWLDWRCWIFRPASFARRSFAATMRRRRVREELLVLRPARSAVRVFPAPV